MHFPYRTALFALLLTWLGSTAIAQSERSDLPGLNFDGQRGHWTPDWKSDRRFFAPGDSSSSWQTPWFTDAAIDPQVRNLPCFEITVPLNRGQRLEVVQGQGLNPETVNRDWYRSSGQEAFSAGNAEWYPEQAVVAGEIQLRQGRPYQILRLYPIRIHRQGNRYERSTSIQFQVRQVSAPVSAGSRSGKTYADHSVLATGKWLKVAVLKDGLYKIDHSTLAAQGISPSDVDPRTLKLYGNGGTMLPQRAGTFPYDDLQENAVWVSGQADGRFDPGDYLLFYGSSPHAWRYYPVWGRWAHELNLYSDTTFYFLTYGGSNGLRVQTPPDPGPATFSPDRTDQFFFREEDKFNALKSGRYWLGESFDLTTSRDYDFNLPRIKSGTDIQLTIRLGARSQATSRFDLRANGSNLGNLSLGAVSYSGYGYWYRYANRTYALGAGLVLNDPDRQLTLNLNYNKPLVSSEGYLDFIEVMYQADLDLQNASRWSFVARENVGPGQVFGYELRNTGNDHRVWDVTDPTRPAEMDLTRNGNRLQFRVLADTIRRFVAFEASAAEVPVRFQAVANQDLHRLEPADLLIVTSTALTSQAQRLAEFHRNRLGHSVHVATLPRIYNEFGSGQADPTAVRDFVKMFYDRWQTDGGTQPKYLLLFGDGGYDYKGISHGLKGTEVPTYQSRNSDIGDATYTSDDYFGFLDDGEGHWGESTTPAAGADYLYYVAGDTGRTAPGLDIAVGRLPVASLDEARASVDKIIGYKTDPAGQANWRQRVILVADHRDADGSLHLNDAEGFPGLIRNSDPCVNVDKLYMDNYQMTNTASGVQFPEGKDALHRALDEGSLIVNYTGHGGEVAWSDASILTISEINALDNGVRLPAYVTATCEFGRWDDPARRSGAEQLVLNPNGGAIAMFTTLRVVYTGPNELLNRNFYRNVFESHPSEDRMMTMGEVYMHTKNASWQGGAINNRKFCLLGDPAIALNYPELDLQVTRINGQPVQPNVVDTLGTLSLVTIEGEVRDRQGNLASNFNGELSATVFDKPGRFTTQRSPINFFWQKNRVFNGKATVSGGRFSFQFVVPLDVTYDDGLGKISLYAQNGQTDGGGCRLEIYPGGTTGNAVQDDRAPELTLYMNDEKFVDGGMTDQNPLLVAEVYDENGLNTVGTGIGHELSAILDGRSQRPIVLNDYYEAAPNSYQEGEIRYPFYDLDPGPHDLEVKVWDVANNSATAKVGFVVADNAELALGHVLNYPNPFSTHTKFFVEHNLNGKMLDLRVRIYTVSGRLVKTLQDAFYAEGNLYCDLEWDGLDEYGDVLGRGVYVYQVELLDQASGEKVNRFEKLVLLR